MKPTHDTVKVELQNVITGQMITWRHCSGYVPTQVFLEDRIDKQRQTFASLLKKNDIQTGDDGRVNYDEIDDDRLVAELAFINHTVLKLQLGQLACVIEPTHPLPDGQTKIELLEECISSYEVIPQILNFFSQHTPSSTGSPADGRKRIRLIKANGEEIKQEARSKKGKARSKKQEASPSESSSTG